MAIPVADRPALTPYFDAVFYRVAYPDALAVEPDPLLHFLLAGFGELRMPHPLIDLRFIVAMDQHALGRPPRLEALVEVLEYDLTAPGPYFDPEWYRRSIGARAPTRAALRHFLGSGLAEGWRPTPMLDPGWYAARHADAPDGWMGAIRHAVLFGDPQARAMSPEFDGAAYRARNPDVWASNIPPLAHFVVWGRREGRQPVAAIPAHPGERLGEALAAPTVAGPSGTEPASVDAADCKHAYDAMGDGLRALRQELIDAVRPRPIRLVRCGDTAARLAALRLPYAGAPLVSILIPLFNELAITVECLMAIVKSRPRTLYEVVIADDGSTDPDVRLLDRVAHLRVIRQVVNRGFIRNCNAAFLQCRAPLVLLLNNDTQVQVGAIDRLAAVLDEMGDVAAAGAKLLYPNGRLQEAGCSLAADGRSTMVGLDLNPDDARFCYDRDVAYCSAAALMVRRSALGDQLFDTRYEPAYCEDADLCMNLRESGHRVRYVHEAVVVHHLSVSASSLTRKMRIVTRNQQTLATRWRGQLTELERVRTLAFYLPQFHPTPENDLWWGKGFTEWSNVAKARPSYAGHYQPHLPADLGFYDLRSTETLIDQARLAGRYGIEGFCVYHYNMTGTPMLSRPLSVVRAHPEIPFRWCLCWANENWTRRWDGGDGALLAAQSYEADVLDRVIGDAVEQARDPRYITVNGKPLFLVYRPLLIPDPAAFAARCRKAFRAAGFAGVHLVYTESMETASGQTTPARLGFDASVEFPPHGHGVEERAPPEQAAPGYRGTRYNYRDTVLAFARRPGVAHARYPAVFPAWDNTARQPHAANSFVGAKPELFRAYVEQKAAEARQMLLGEERLLFINAWNEWAEGAHLEPDVGYGHRWLEALRDGLAEASA